MSSSAALSNAVMSGATRPALSQLVAANTSQTRSIWRCARNNQAKGDKTERISQRIDKYRRHPLANSCSKAETRDWPSTTHRQSTGRWAMWRSRSAFSELSVGRDTPSYSAIHHGRPSKPDSIWPDFLPSFLKTEYSVNSQRTDSSSKAHLQDFNFLQSPQTSHFEGLRYDPISGRMAPPPPKPETQQKSTEQSCKPVIDCPPGNEVEAKFVSSPSLVEDGQFQPWPSTTAGHFPSQHIPNSQTVDCSPGSELEALFAADPSSFQKAQVMPRVPEESAHKPNIHVACPPGNELEAFFISESIPSEKPHAEIYKGQEKVKIRDLNAGLKAMGSVECSPGSELEAMFATKPAARVDQSRPIEAFDAHPVTKQACVPVDCPPGNELEAKFASELSTEAAQHTPSPKASPQSIDCSPGSELEAKIVSDIASRQSQQTRATAPVDCAPGNELEALFISDPIAAANTDLKPAVVTEPANIKKANVTVDCQPGNELEAKMISDAATNGNTEDLGTLQACEIRARYVPKPRPAPNNDFNGSEDRVGDLLLKNQEIATETQEPAAYRILAYDSSEAQVTTAEAQSFFGNNDAAQPHEILARLHNPARFVPFFAQLQQEGFEIATGGGDILVFKKAANSRRQVAAQPAMEQEDPLVQSQIAQYLRHDSYPIDSSASTSGSSFQPSSGSGPSTSEGGVSSIGTMSLFRRIILTGIITTASCYAISVVIEYFRIGGEDGRGIDGFTAFESERYRREER